MFVSWRIEAGSITFVAHPNRHTKDAAACSCDKSACRVAANSATDAFSFETTKTAYNNLDKNDTMLLMVSLYGNIWKEKGWKQTEINALLFNRIFIRLLPVGNKTFKHGNWTSTINIKINQVSWANKGKNIPKIMRYKARSDYIRRCLV